MFEGPDLEYLTVTGLNAGGHSDLLRHVCLNDAALAAGILMPELLFGAGQGRAEPA